MDISTLTIGEARDKMEDSKKTYNELSALFGQSSLLEQ